MIGLDENVISLAFDMSRREAGKLLYQYIRSQMVHEDPPHSLFKPKKKEIEDDESIYSKYASGMFSQSVPCWRLFWYCRLVTASLRR